MSLNPSLLKSPADDRVAACGYPWPGEDRPRDGVGPRPPDVGQVDVADAAGRGREVGEVAAAVDEISHAG